MKTSAKRAATARVPTVPANHDHDRCKPRLPLLALAAALATFGMPVVAHAQTVGSGDAFKAYVSPPAEQLMTSPGGVDMRTQQYVYRNVDLALGEAAAAARLSLERISLQGVPAHITPFANFTHNFDIMLTERRVDIAKGDYVHGAGTDYRFGVRMGGLTDTFETPGYAGGYMLQTTRGSAATLTSEGARDSAGVRYTYVTNDGTEVLFRPLGSGDCTFEARCAYVLAINYPDGTRLAFEYETLNANGQRARLRNVTSSRGYALLFQYGASSGEARHVAKACLLNLAVAPKPASGICPASALSRADYGYTTVTLTRQTGFANGRPTSTTDAIPKLASYADNGSPPKIFSYTPISQEYPQYTMAFTHAGDAQPWLTNTVFDGVNEEFGPKELVYSQQFADGRTYSYEFFDPSSLTAGAITTLAGGAYYDNLGKVTFDYGFYRLPRSMYPPGNPLFPQEETVGSARWQMTSGPVRITDHLGRVTEADYCDRYSTTSLPPSDGEDRCLVTLMQSYTDPEGIRTELFYDPNKEVQAITRHPKPGSSLAPLTPGLSYDANHPKLRDKPIWVRDANGTYTYYTYDPAHGGLLTELKPKDANGVQAKTRYAYVRRRARISNGAGGHMEVGTPVWLLAEQRFCRTTATIADDSGCAGGAADEVVTSYDYGPDSGPSNLLLRGLVVTADGQSRRTCYLHDARGNRVAETKPRAGLSACQ